MRISATGMVCPVGMGAAAACAALRAGVSAFCELPFSDDAGRPVIGAPVPDMDFDRDHEARLAELLAAALRDCLAAAGAVGLERVPLLVGLAEPGRPGGAAALAATIRARVQERLEVRLHPELSRVVAKGHTAGFEALRLARQVLDSGAASACLVCGVDSYLNAPSLYWLERHGRLKTVVNSNGVIPGEGAAAVLLQSRPGGTGLGTEVIGLGFGMEKAHVLSEEPLLGLGLTAAAREALAEAKLGYHEVDWRLSDVTGEAYGFKEQGLTLLRLMRQQREAFPLWHCADSIGDTGAAAGVCELVAAHQAFVKGYAPGDRVISFTSSVPGERAAAVLRRRRTEVRRP
jgi:3-oxoacyl-[acyl-carrier-protein] synthase-1